MSLLLDFCYVVLLLLTAPWFVLTSMRTGKYREGWGAKFLGRVPRRTGNAPCVWFHAVSVGEVNLLDGILAEFERRRPDIQCVLSTTTRTGYQLAQRKYSGHTVFYCPLDFSWAVAAALQRIRPRMLVLVELELWPNLVSAARRHDVSVAIINGRLSETSWRGYRRMKWLIARVMHRIDVVAAQSELYAQRFVDVGARAETVQVTGSIKFDNARTNRHNPETERLTKLAGITATDMVFLAGSTQSPEEGIVVSVYQHLAQRFPQLRLLLVPRHPQRFDEVARLLDDVGGTWQRRSELDTAGADSRARILLVDSVGELGHWWGTAHIAFVGGSLGSRGGQNMIEPAAYGSAVSFGPNTRNFRDVVAALLAEDAAIVVKDQKELLAFVERCLADVTFRGRLGARVRQLVVSQRGAARRTVDLLEPHLPRARKVGSRWCS